MKALLLALPIALASASSAQQTYYEVALNELTITKGSLPSYTQSPNWEIRQRWAALAPYAWLEGDGDCMVDERSPGTRFSALPGANAFLVVRTDEPMDVSGVLVVPNNVGSGMVRLPFEIPASAAKPDGEEIFLRAVVRRSQRLLARGVAGAAWFRHELDEARTALGDTAEELPAVQRWRNSSASDAEDTMNMVTGGRAVSENLQLDRLLPAPAKGEETVDVATIEGITVAEMDWAPLLEGKDPALDSLAPLVPADQYAVFFPSFEAMTTLIDEAKEAGAPLLSMFEERSRDAGTRERYERQLCLSLDVAARVFGPLVVSRLAVTGSDPYLRTGSDLAVLFEAKNAETLHRFLLERQAAVASDPHVTRLEGRVQGVDYHAVVSLRRQVSSYLATFGDVVVVSNSFTQLERIVALRAGETPTLAAAPEYRFFRTRYPLGDPDETAFLIVPDAAIRLWCGPAWRIAASRRTRAAAALAELTAAHLDDFARDPGLMRGLETGPELAWLDDVTIQAGGVSSTRYGSLDFLTPIAEDPIERVSVEEKQLYERWRDGYQRNWSGVFDPIAARFTVEPQRLGLDLMVLPLIGNSDYRELIAFSGDAQLDPYDGDPHADALLHFTMALDPDSEEMASMGRMLGTTATVLGANPMSWIDNSMSIYVDRDSFWQDFVEGGDFEEAMENAWVDPNAIPLVIQFDISSGVKLAAFIGALRATVSGFAPDLLTWDTLEDDDGRAYVRISSTGLGDEFSLYYATLPDAWILSLQEAALKRAMDRAEVRRLGEDPAQERDPWLGRSVAFDVRDEGFAILQLLGGETFEQSMRAACFSNLPILNEWKRRFPERDPVQVHLELWGERLVCPAGGTYRWNEGWATMESSVFGHPGQPGDGPRLPGILEGAEELRTGLTFELGGLRARAELWRE